MRTRARGRSLRRTRGRRSGPGVDFFHPPGPRLRRAFGALRCRRPVGGGPWKRPATIVVVDAGDELERAQRCVRKLGGFAPLAEVPLLLALTVARLPGLDFSTGVHDFVLKPV